ncbi:MAG: hypothetical protein K8R86_09030, partial [Bacteroidales bacterium]|nr:hypothetical protein [Bacteroidales bacterium]
MPFKREILLYLIIYFLIWNLGIGQTSLTKDSLVEKSNPGNYGLASAGTFNTYQEVFTYQSGWNWVSFPRME